MATDSTIEIKRGDDWETICTFTVNGVALDVHDCYIWFTAKTAKEDADIDAVIGPVRAQIPDNANAALGIYLFTLGRVHTDVPVGSYFYDFQLLDRASKVKTLGDGRLKIVQDITQTVAITP